jgi:outer membrane protein assembly complex protein YaeT
VTRARRIVVGLALAGLAALVFAALGLFPQEPGRHRLESRLRRSFGPGSRVGALDLRPGALRGEARDVVIDAPGARVEVDRLELALSPGMLWGGGIDVRRLRIDGARVVITAGGPSGARATPWPGNVVVRDLQVSKATVVYRDPALGGDAVLSGVDVRGGVGEGTLAVRMDGGVWPGAPPLRLGPGTARVRVSPRLELWLDAFEAGLERSRVRASGRLGSVWSPDVDLHFEGGADLAEIADRAGIAPARGGVRAEGTLRGPLAALQADVQLSSDGARVRGWDVEGITGRLRSDAGGAEATADVTLLGGRGHLEARLSGGRLRARVTARGLDAVRLQREADLGRSLRTGRLDVDASVEGARSGSRPDQPFDLDVDVRGAGVLEGAGPIQLQARARGPLRAESPGPQVDLAWNATVGGEPVAALRDLRLTLGGTAKGGVPPVVEATLDGSVTAQAGETPLPLTVRGTFRSHGDATTVRLEAHGLGAPVVVAADLAGAVARALDVRADGIELDRLAPGTAGRARLDFSASGPLNALTGKGALSVEGLAARDVVVGAADMKVTATRGAFDVTVAAPALAVTGDLRVRARPAPELSGTLHFADTPLAPFVPLVGDATSLTGRVRGDVELRAPLRRPEAGVAVARIDALEAASGAWRAESRRPFSLELREGALHVRDLELAGPGTTLTAEGSLGTGAAGALQMTVRADVDLARLGAPDGWTLAGAAHAEVAVTGSRRRPLAHGGMDLASVAVAGPSLPPIAVGAGRIELRGDVVALPGLAARVAEGEVHVSGTVPLAAVWREARRRPARPSDDEKARLAVSWRGVQVSALARHLRPDAAVTSHGALSGDVEVTGGLASLAEVEARAVLPATSLQVQDVALDVEPATLRVLGGRISTEALVVRTAGGSLRVEGHADLVRRDLDVTGRGEIDLRALSPFLTDSAVTGAANLDVAVRGTIDAPRPEGSLTVRDGTLRTRALPQAVTGLEARVDFGPAAIRLTEARARLGGGELTAAGQAQLAGTSLRDVRVDLTGRDIALTYPVGMRTRLDADLALTGATGAFLLTGTVKATRGLYDLDVALQQGLTARVVESADSPLLRSVALDVRVETPNPVLVRNNLAQLQATGRLTVRGDAQSPTPLGTLEIAPGGKVFLQGREFAIQAGRLTYQGNWDPTLSVSAASVERIADRRTPQSPVDVTVSLGGTLEKPAVTLTSTPPLTERELVNLVTSGDSQDSGAAEAVGGQAAALLVGRLTRSLRGLGFDEVTIRPELVAREGGVEPGARFTFGKRITRRSTLLYSANLQDPEGRFVQLEADPGRDVHLTVQRTDAGLFTYGAGQRFRFGGPARARAPGDERVRISEIRLEGDRPLEPSEMTASLGTRRGDRRTIWDLQERAERLRQRLIDRGYLEAEVGARLDGTRATFHVRSGARYRWQVSGFPGAPDLGAAVRQSLFEEEALERGRARLLSELHRRGHLRAAVAARAVADGEGRTLVFDVDPGPRTEAVEVHFPGASALRQGALRDAAGGAAGILGDPEAAARNIAAAYRKRHYLAVRVERPRVEESAGRAVITVPVHEGARARVGAVRFTGTTASEERLRGRAGLHAGAEFQEADVEAAVDRLREDFFRRGYAAVRINPVVEPQGDALEVVFQVTEGPRRVVGEVEIRGLRRTSPSLVQRELRLVPGRPVDPRELVAIERRLLDLGVFARASVAATDDDPSTIVVTVEEGDRAVAGYVLRYDDEDGTRSDLDGELRNLFGSGLSAGGRFGVARDQRELRGVLSLPRLFRLGRLTASAFRLDEDLPSAVGGADGADAPDNIRQQVGGQVQLTRRLGRRWEALAGYRFKRTRLLPLFPDPIDVAGLDLSLLRDTRDSTLDARRGRFWSFSLEYSPAGLGSDLRFVKGLVQVFAMRPLGPDWTWAQGARLGLSHGFEGQRLISTERFRAGGANTLRGFATDSAGPRDAFGDPAGGEAVFVLNEELRYHHRSGLGAAVFYDAGNVFAGVSDLGFDWRHSLGAGLRWASPVGLLRVDLGFPMRPRAGERRYQYFFSLGQAF